MNLNLTMFLQVVKYKGLILSLFVLLQASCHQEKMVFHPEPLSADFEYQFKNEFKELSIDVGNEAIINGLLFKSKDSKGLIFICMGMLEL